jgi:nucleoside-diphosphate-sugar epimerase
MMSGKLDIFLAGAGGAIGRRLVPQLIAAGHRVHGTSRHAERLRELAAMGLRPVVVDALDRQALLRAVDAASPDIVVHQLTDLPREFPGAMSSEALEANARVREEGTANLIEAAILAGAHRIVSQSVAWLYAGGPEPHTEEDPLIQPGEGLAAISLRGVLALERMTLQSPPLEGVVLRYGRLYGPGTWYETPDGSVPVHVDAAANAALLAVESSRTGVFNIAEQKGAVSAERARCELGWSADYRLKD